MPKPPMTAARVRRAACAVSAVTAFAVAGIAVPPAGAAKKPKPVVKIAPGEVTVYKVGGAPDTIPDAVRSAVMATLVRYVKAATVTALQKGKADEVTLTSTLAPGVAGRLTGPDRAVLVDEGLPKPTSAVKVSAAPVALTGLADGDSAIVVVTAGVDATATAKTAKGKVVVKRRGDLVLESENGAWKITGYTLTVDRTGKGVKPSATAPVAPTAAPTPTTAAR
ncbi:MAG: hypothetical protein ACKOA9_07130 [Actinomycetota bacterium]